MPTALILLSMLPVFAGFQQDAPTLESLRDQHRVLLIFAPSREDADFTQQLTILSAHPRDLDDRDLVMLPQVAAEPSSSQATLRRRFHVAPGHFTVVLIGKDSGEKLRLHKPVAMTQLNAIIDAMPMRQDEIRRQSR